MVTQDELRRVEEVRASARAARWQSARARAKHRRREKELFQKAYGPTTLHDYLRNCHTHLHKKVHLVNWPGPTSSTNITGKFYPEVLLPWTEFETDIVPRHFGVIDKICGDVHPFPSKNHSVYDGPTIWRTPVGTQRNGFIFWFKPVEVPVRNILEFVASREEFQTKYDTADVCFSNRRNEVSQSDGAASDSKASGAGLGQGVGPETAPKPEFIGLRTRNNGDECLAFVYDIKAAHTVDTKYVRAAVAKPHLFAEVLQRINSAQTTTNGAVRDREEAEASIAASIVQVYDYMVTYDVAYGYVAAGYTLLLLHVDRNDPQTLFCHLCMPPDVAGPINGSIDVTRTTVAKMLCFCLQSFQSGERPGGSRSLAAAFVRAVTSVKTWPVPYMDASQSTDEWGLMSTERASARRIGLRSHSSYKLGGVLPRRNADGKGDAPMRQYCTQACLLGLQLGHDLDENCPNVALHRTGRADVSRHPLDAGQFADLMGQQLRRDPYHKCALVNYWMKGGAMGWMFKLELQPYGYTLVGKGTVAGRRSRLEHEGRIYERLSSLQGHLVPVHLGLVDMGRGYIIPSFRFVVHMMLMSWAGEALDHDAEKTLRDKWCMSASTIFRADVDHGDNCKANYVWSAERGCVMIIDFDCARLLDMPGPPQISGS